MADGPEDVMEEPITSELGEEEVCLFLKKAFARFKISQKTGVERHESVANALSAAEGFRRKKKRRNRATLPAVRALSARWKTRRDEQ